MKQIPVIIKIVFALLTVARSTSILAENPTDTITEQATKNSQEKLWQYLDILAKTSGKAVRGSKEFAHYAPLIAKAATWDLYKLVITFKELKNRITNQILPGYTDWDAKIKELNEKIKLARTPDAQTTLRNTQTALSTQLLVDTSPFLLQTMQLGTIVNDGYIYIFSPKLYTTLDDFFEKSTRFITALQTAAQITQQCVEKKLSSTQKAEIAILHKKITKPVHKWIKEKAKTKAWRTVNHVKEWTPESIKNAADVAQNIKVLNKTIKKELIQELETWEKLYTEKKLSPAADAYYAMHVLQKMIGPLKRVFTLATSGTQEIEKIVKKPKQKELFNALHTFFDYMHRYVQTGVDQLVSTALECIPTTESITPEDKKILENIGINTSKFTIKEKIDPATLHFTQLFNTLKEQLTIAQDRSKLQALTGIDYAWFIEQALAIDKDLDKYPEEIKNTYEGPFDQLVTKIFKSAASYSSHSIDEGIKELDKIKLDKVLPQIKNVTNQPSMSVKKIESELWQPFEIAIDLAKQAIDDGQMLDIEKDIKLLAHLYVNEQAQITAAREKLTRFQAITKKIVYRILNIVNKSSDKEVITYLAEIAPYILIHYSELLAEIEIYSPTLAKELALSRTPEKFIDLIKKGIEKSLKRLDLTT